MNISIKAAGDASWPALRAGGGRGVALLLLMASCLATGCSSIRVNSNPSGAHVLMNGVDTGRLTPTSIRVRDLHMGRSTISVEQEGYLSVPAKQEIEVGVSVGDIVVSVIVPPVLIGNLFGNFWKGIDYPESERLEEFQLRSTSAAPAVATAVQHPAAPAAVPDPAKRKPVTNADVVGMIKANLSEKTILGAIQHGPAAFDTSPAALIELKQQGVSDEMLQAMLQAQSPTPRVPPQTRLNVDTNVAQGAEVPTVVGLRTKAYGEQAVGK